jgi:hypothetical protein
VGVKSGHHYIKININPAGSYVPEPKDGFEFSCSRKGKNNEIVNILLYAFKNGGKIIINIKDTRNKEKTINAEFEIGEQKNLFAKII